MRILCLIDSLASGGAQRQFVGLASLLKDNNFEVKVVWYHNILFYKPLLDQNNVAYSYCDIPKNRLSKLVFVRNEILSFKPSVVISYIDGANVILCLLKSFGMKFKLIVSERNTSQNLKLYDRLKFFLYKMADIIVPNSYSQELFIKSHYKNLANRIVTITNFVDIDYFQSTDNSYQNLSHNNILVVGRVVPQKNVIGFIETIKLLKLKRLDFRVYWYGEAYDCEYYNKCNKLIAEYNLEDHFNFCNQTKNILDVYKSASVLCLPSLFEGFPNVICEGMSCSLPILCSDICDNGMLVKEGLNGFLFNPLNPKSMATSIEKYLSLDISSRIRMGKNSRSYIVNTCSKQSFINKYINLLKNLDV